MSYWYTDFEKNLHHYHVSSSVTLPIYSEIKWNSLMECHQPEYWLRHNGFVSERLAVFWTHSDETIPTEVRHFALEDIWISFNNKCISDWYRVVIDQGIHHCVRFSDGTHMLFNEEEKLSKPPRQLYVWCEKDITEMKYLRNIQIIGLYRGCILFLSQTPIESYYGSWTHNKVKKVNIHIAEDDKTWWNDIRSGHRLVFVRDIRM